MNVIFVCLTYSPGMPALYITSFLDLLLTYLTDKWICKIYHNHMFHNLSIVLRRARNPTNYDEKLELIVRDILFWIILIHLTFAIWTYGNVYIFPSV